jgi:hypothetical protein
MRLSCWLNDWKENRAQKLNAIGHLSGERLGQAFCNDYVRCSWPELYYCENEEESLEMIVDFLVQHHYYPMVPHRTGDRF